MPNRDLDKSFAAQRKDYSGENISQESIEGGPFSLFETWYKNALTLQNLEVNAMCLSTVSSEGRPSSRMVLLKGYGADGFCFYTNYLSRKGRELEANSNAALLFYWGAHERQVRIEGTVSKLTAEQSDEYFSSRPREAQLSAACSPQSWEISGRDELLNLRKSLENQVGSGRVLRPASWGGYCVSPVRFEFWQGQASRLHDRVAFEKDATQWRAQRLAP